MGRAPCCDKASVKRGPWSPEEDAALKDYIEKHGTGGNWLALPQKAGLRRCGKSCRLRWLNYLRPNIKHGDFTDFEDGVICTLYATIGSRWSVIAAQLPGRTDNDIKNYFNTKLKKKLMAQTALISPYSLPRLNSHGLQNPSPALPSLSASPSSYSLSPADLQWPSTHDGINFENPMQHYQVKKGGSPIIHGGGGGGGGGSGEAACGSSEAKHNFSSSSSATGGAAESDQAVSYDYCPYRAVEEQENSSGSGGRWTRQAVADKGWGENAVIADHDYGFEQIMQLIISNNSTCSFLFDENKVGGSEYY